MDAFFENAPALLTAAAKNPLGILGLMVIALSVIAALWFHSSSAKVKISVFVFLMAGVTGYAFSVIQQVQITSLGRSANSSVQGTKPDEQTTNFIPSQIVSNGKQCNENNPLLECLWIR